MNLHPQLFSPFILWAATFLWLALTLYAGLSIRWQSVRQHRIVLHIFFASTLTLTLLSLLRTGVLPNLGIHLMGLTAATLMMGWRFSLLANALSLILLSLLQIETPLALGLNGLLQGAIPIFISYGFCRLLQRLLPHNPFIFTLGAAFFGGCLALAGVILTTALTLSLLDIYPWTLTWHKYTKFLPVIIYPEGFINGVFISAMVAFYPSLLSCFNPKSYFKGH